MTRSLLVLLALCFGCPAEKPDDTGSHTPAVDADGDGYSVETDCDDADRAIHPGATEICDGIDNDCDGFVDDRDPAVEGAPTWYLDGDLDGYGSDVPGETACVAPEGQAATPDDCDDADAAVHPGAEEWCNGVDDDCDDTTDEDAVDAPTWYTDADGDGWGDDRSAARACSAPGSTVADGGDCDDGDPAVHPGADEWCNGVDDDCDDTTDEDDALDATTWYGDGDRDGYGDPHRTTTSCTLPPDHADNGEDCDDLDATVFPGAEEWCNGVDDDCDGTTDEDDALDAPTWYLDADGDTWGDAASASVGCSAPPDHVADGTDCDDLDATVFPGADERCNGVDDDCDGTTDEDGALDAPTWYLDADGDTWGDPADGLVACTAPAGRVEDGTDCDDGDATVHPGATETCDGVDQDCDGTADDDPTDGTPWYPDADGDGWGDDADVVRACTDLAGYLEVGGDCDGTDADIHPGATEHCDGVDGNCDGVVDTERLATFTTGVGAVTDLTATLAAGTATSPAFYAISRSGTLTLCDGTWFATLQVSAPTSTIRSLHGPEVTTVSAGGTGRLVYATTTGTLRLEDLTLTGGDAGTGNGGVVRSTVAGAALEVDGCTLGGNAAWLGGALYTDGVDVVITDSTFTGNLAESDGGALYVAGGTLSVTGSTFSGNGSAWGDGGALLADEATVTVASSTFEGNEASLGWGGAVYQYFGTASFDGCAFGSNSATLDGGALSVQAGDLYLADTTFTGNTADRGGALEASDLAGVDAARVDFLANTADTCGGGVLGNEAWLLLFEDSTFEGNLALQGGGLCLDDTAVSLEDSLVSANVASTFGAGAWMEGGAELVCTAAAAAATAGFLSNEATVGGGGVYVQDGTLQSTLCDWGTSGSSTDNTPDDVHLPEEASGRAYGDDATFTCVPGGGCA